MSVLVDKNEVHDFLNQEWKGNLPEKIIEALISQVTNQAETTCKRKLLYAQYTSMFSGDSGKQIILPAAPVWEIVEVKVDDEDFDGYTADLENGLLIAWKWPPGVANIKVVFKAGWNADSEGEGPAPPADLSGAIRDEVIARFLMQKSKPRVGADLVDLTTDFLMQSANRTLKNYRLYRL